jgi:hypothetical protein
MWIFYLLAFIPIIFGAILWITDKEIVWWEWLIGAATTFLMAGIFNYAAVHGMTDDKETWSGHITRIHHYPEWEERWTEHHSETTTDSKGHSHTHTWTTTEYDTHYEYWNAERDFGSYQDTERLDQSTFNELASSMGGQIVEDGMQSYDHNGTQISGDRHYYGVNNTRRYVAPVTAVKTFENRIKAAPSLFSFSSVPTNIPVYSWPENSDWLHSDRVLGTARGNIDCYQWDCLNSRLGSSKRVNLIIVGFGDKPEDYGHYQQAKWIGGKKNDLVICYGGGDQTHGATWAYVFGWTENELVKEDLKSLLMTQPINNQLIPAIEQEVRKNYVIKDWHKFDYITIEPPTWSYYVFFLVLILTQGGLYAWFHFGDVAKIQARRDSFSSYTRFGRRNW